MHQESVHHCISQPTIRFWSATVCELHCANKVFGIDVMAETSLEFDFRNLGESVYMVLVGECVHCGMNGERLVDLNRVARLFKSGNTSILSFRHRLLDIADVWFKASARIEAEAAAVVELCCRMLLNDAMASSLQGS
jgi:hypothetical protein